MSEDSSQSQTLRAVLGLRSLIIEGKLKPGERVSELSLVDRLGISRTPARLALQQVRDQGLLDSLPSTGFVVAEFSEKDAFEAIEIRGTLEGMAARFAAEHGASQSLLDRMRRCVDELDVFIDGIDTATDVTDYIRLNDIFHELLLEASQSQMLQRQLERLYSLPFAAPNAFVDTPRPGTAGIKRILIASQEQHRSILEAIQNREGTRAQAIAIEHSRSATKYLRIALDAEVQPEQLPAMSLITRRRTA